MDRPYNLLFLCTGNSARSILAEALANQVAKSRFRAYSAGSHPRGRVHPMALQVLDEAGIATDGLRSKPWDEFATPDAPPMDLIITVCDKAAGEACPLWPGHPVTAHWGIEDPASVAGSQEQVHKAFGKALQLLQHRLSLLMALQPEALDRLALETRVREIGTAS
ncbi:hypothetical protein ASD77_08805 [Pseudoxanthomonas sp. Root65]|uniref:arsenate reductase ArsC n=1 Tax=Pseudoxanthomonas sp. Root65 TaxID=1736576 RepID=UPI0006FF1DD2|nr:arsenate reductase ArsC [Pseudoxanthomonas sp. Root65]KRA54674.1 hypothetical protein ASD77_08805 [Pseudoxanthomonas sp. Root65]